MKILIHKILKEEFEKKNIFVPHNLESRSDQKLQSIYRKLEQEVIDGDLYLFDAPLAGKYTDEEIRKIVNVRGRIVR